MISSMTGFGRGHAEHGEFASTVEIKTVNSRFCEVTIRGPRTLSEFETDMQRIVKESVARGRVSVNVQLDRTAEAGLPLSVNVAGAIGYRKLLEEVCRVADLKDEPIRLDHMLRFNELLVEGVEDEDAPKRAWVATEEALQTALTKLAAMRRNEGDALRDELLGRIDGIAERLAEIERLVPERVPAAHQRLQERLAEILGDGRFNVERLEQEMAMLADRLDVTEECVRLHAHLAVFREAMDTPEAVGRKLNFLSQEINREVNTIGSKSNDADMAHLVVGMKEDLEKIREQVENVE